MALFSDDMCLLSGPLPDGDCATVDLEPAGPVPPSRPARCAFPLTKSQEGIWVEYQSDPSSTRYNLTMELNLETECTISDIIKGSYCVHDFEKGIGKKKHEQGILTVCWSNTQTHNPPREPPIYSGDYRREGAHEGICP